MAEINPVFSYFFIILVKQFGWNREGTDIFYFINTRTVEDKLKMINLSPITIDYIIKKTDKMKRLHEVKWKL